MALPTPRWRLWLYWALTAAGFASVLALNLPGQMSTDSVMQLFEGRNDRQLTFNPWIMSWLLGLSDRLTGGTGLFMALNAAVLFGTLAALPLLAPDRIGRLAPIALGLMLLTPQVVSYQGIVWKDVLFANLAVAGFTALALSFVWREQPPLRWAALIKALALLSVAALVRQNGVIAGLMAAIVLGLVEGGRLGWRRGALAGVGGFIALLALTVALGAALKPGETTIKSPGAGLRVLRHYDVVAAVARDPAFDLSALPPERAAVIRNEAARLYTPERVDTLDSSPEITRALWQSPREAMEQTWWRLVREHPGLYLSHRLAVFDQVLRTPRLERCLPAIAGVIGPARYVQALGLDTRLDDRDRWLQRYTAGLQGTPLFSHLAFAVLAGAVFGALAVRRRPADLAVMGLMAAALGFAASFLLISLACDYRYLYMLDLAALVGAVYWAIDPPRLVRQPKA